MKFGQAVSLVCSVHTSSNKQTIFLLGPPGIGKSSVAYAAKDVIKSKGLPEPEVVVVDLSNALPEDLNGIPKVDGEVMKFIPDEWLYKLCQPDATAILVLDDLPAASPAIQVATRQLALDRRIHNHKLADGVTIMVTGNRATDSARAAQLPSHFRNSVLLISMDPDFDSWLEWYRKQCEVDRSIVGYLLFSRGSFSKTPQESDALGAFATPRSWSMLGRMLHHVKELGDEDIVRETVFGLVGIGVGTEYLAFEAMQKDKIDMDAFMLDPEKTLPDPADCERSYLVALCSGAATRVVSENKGIYVYDNLVKVAIHVSRNKRDMFAYMFQLVESLGGPEARKKFALAVSKDMKTNPEARVLLQSIADILGSYK